MMNKQQILKRIGQIIDDLKEQHNYLIASEEHNVLEMELFAANSDFLIDHISILKKLETSFETHPEEEFISLHPIHSTIENDYAEVLEPQEKEIASAFIFPALETYNIENESKAADMMFVFEQDVKVDQIFDREFTPEESKVLQEKQAVFSKLNEVNQPEPIDTNTEDISKDSNPIPFDSSVIFVVDNTNSAPSISSENDFIESIINNETKNNVENELSPMVNIEEKKQTLNDFLSNQSNVQNISSRLSNMATQDLKSAITLNDKMLFIKELFNGYNLAYSEALEILNRFDSFEAADNFLLKNYSLKNKWVDKQEVVDKFYAILNRRYVK